MSIKRLNAFFVLCGLVLCLCRGALADDEVKTILDFKPEMDLSKLETKATISLYNFNGDTSLKLVGPPKLAFPGLHYAPANPLDLTGAKGIETDVTNLSDEVISVSLRAENDTDGKAGHWSVASIQLGPKDTRTLQMPFGLKYGKPDPNYVFDPAKIVGVTFYIANASDNERSVLVKNIRTFTKAVVQQPIEVGKPPSDGLVLWLDPSKADTVTADADRHISVLTDRSGQHHDAKAASNDAAPVLDALQTNHRPKMHFEAKSSLKIDAIRPASGGVTVFVVYAKAKDKNPTLTDDGDLLATPDFRLAAIAPKSQWKLGGNTIAVENAPIGPITLGDGFSGDIGEVLVYDHVFTAEGERVRVMEYLGNKWNVGFPDPSWVRDGPLDPKPERTHDDLPLSDQANAGKWTLDPTFTDDFKGPEIDPKRYEVFCTDNGKTQWLGRSPGLFIPANTVFQDGLHIKLDKASPEQMKAHPGYKYTTGYVQTRQRTGYGYYEIEAKVAHTAIDNAFWLANTGDPNNGLEIDIFEQGPHTRDFAKQDIMTAHVWGENGDKHHFGWLVNYNAPFDLSADFHVYGFAWTKDELVWYLDGSVVRKMKNTSWHLPMLMIFDAEPMSDWFGAVDEKDLPTEYTVKYVRVWRQE